MPLLHARKNPDFTDLVLCYVHPPSKFKIITIRIQKYMTQATEFQPFPVLTFLMAYLTAVLHLLLTYY
jgi:hypothetical protein